MIHKPTFYSQAGISSIGWLVIAVAFILLLVVALPRLAGNTAEVSPNPETETDQEIREEQQEAAVPSLAPDMDTAPSIEDIANNPENYLGKEITVQAAIEDVTNPQAFLLDDPGLMGLRLLVLSSRPVVNITGSSNSVGGNSEGSIVNVSGRLERFDAELVEQTLGNNYDEADFANYDQEQLIIVANTVSQLGTTLNPAQ